MSGVTSSTVRAVRRRCGPSGTRCGRTRQRRGASRVALMAMYGSSLASAGGDHDEAIRLLRTALSHPRIGADAVPRVQLTCDLALELLETGGDTEAVSLLRGLLDSNDRRVVRFARVVVRVWLFRYSMGHDGDEPAPPSLVDFVEQLVQHWRPAVSRRLRRGATFRQVAERIDRTFPPQHRLLTGPAGSSGPATPSPQDDALMGLAGAIETDVPDISDRPDEHIGRGTADDHGGGDHA